MFHRTREYLRGPGTGFALTGAVLFLSGMAIEVFVDDMDRAALALGFVGAFAVKKALEGMHNPAAVEASTVLPDVSQLEQA